MRVSAQESCSTFSVLQCAKFTNCCLLAFTKLPRHLVLEMYCDIFSNVPYGSLQLQVNARWLSDLDVFNEWMNEEDYELADTDGSVSD